MDNLFGSNNNLKDEKSRRMMQFLMDEELQSVLKKERDSYPAIRVFNLLQYGFDKTMRDCRKINPLIERNFEAFRKGAIDNDQFYNECLHGRISACTYKSNFPEYTELLWHNFQLLTSAGYSVEIAEQIIHDLSNMIRNNVLVNRWNKYRKAYVFDRQLEKEFLDVDEEIILPARMVEMMPYPAVYVELPENSALSQYYFGAFVTLRRTNGLRQIMKEVKDGFYRSINGGNIEDDVSYSFDEENLRSRGLTQEQINTLKDNSKKYIDCDQAEDSFVSMHAILLNRQQSDLDGFDFTPYAVILPMAYGEDELCHITVDAIKKNVEQGDFDRRATVRKIIIFLLNAMMYLGAKNADIQSAKFTSEPVTQPKKGKKSVPAQRPVEINECGFVYGKTIREIEKHKRDGLINDDEDEVLSETGEIIRIRKPPRPHPYKAHYRRYHVGKGRTEIIWKHIPAGYAGSNYGKITNVSNVQKE